MEIDTRFPIKLNTVSDAPEPFRSAGAYGFWPLSKALDQMLLSRGSAK
jgi:hypothetical protein